jgi:hypothetical protein
MSERIEPRVGATVCLALCVLVAVVAVVAPDAASAASLRPGSAALEESLLGARYRSFRNTRQGEVHLGVPDLRQAERRSERDVTWVSGPNQVVFTFDPAADRLTTTVSNGAGEFSLEVPELASAIAELGSGRFDTDDLNVVRIRIVGRDAGSTVAFTDLDLDGEALGDVEMPDGGEAVWTIHGHDFAAGFTLRGTIELDGRFSGRADRSRVEIEVGVSDDPFCIEDEAVAAMRTVLDGESPFRLRDVVGGHFDRRLAGIRWSFLADDALYLDGNRDRAYELCSTDAGVMMSIPFRSFGAYYTAHFALEHVGDGFDMHGMQRKIGVDGVPEYLDAGLGYRFQSP